MVPSHFAKAWSRGLSKLFFDFPVTHDVQAIGRKFEVKGTYCDAEPFGAGHINDTYRARYIDNQTGRDYLLQRINHHVFKSPEKVMENMQKVTAHLWNKLCDTGEQDPSRRCLRLIPMMDGKFLYRDSDGNYWRTMDCISGVETFDRVKKPEQAFQAALAFGHFQRLLLDFPATDLHDTIPDFHNTRRRFERFLEVLDADPVDRVSQIPEEVRFLKEHELETSRLLDLQDCGELPLRVTHNDTKLNNVLFDGETGEGICVVDLDTVMPGLSLYDFGDLVRTAATTAAEDERDLNKVRMDIQLFRELVRGYLDALGGALEDQEIQNLAFSARLITMEIGMRFLTDFLEGDVYFKIHRDGHNLDRARNQFQLLRSMEAQVDEMEAVVEKYR